MTSVYKYGWLAGLLLSFPAQVSHGQIRYVTVHAIKSPLPAMALLPPYTGLSNAPAALAPPRRVVLAPPAKPSLDKAELERRVVAFQQQRAAEGSASAQYELGLRYLKGQGVDQDLAAARKWLQLAADSGNDQARTKLGELKK